MNLAEEILRFDIRYHHRRHHPVRNQFSARRTLLVRFQELGQEIFQSHLITPLDEVDDHRIHDIVREAFVLQFFCNGVEVAQSEERLWCAQRWIEGRKFAIAIQPQRISFQGAAREIDVKNVDARCDLTFATQELAREQRRVLEEQLAMDSDTEAAFAFDDDDFVERTVRVSDVIGLLNYRCAYSTELCGGIVSTRRSKDGFVMLWL